MTNVFPFLHIAAALILSPLLIGAINRTKAVFGGRRGQPLLQAYYDIAKLLRKGAVYSRTTTWIFRLAPVVGLAAAITALVLTPLSGINAIMFFSGDLIVFAGALAVMRFIVALAALDTGSAFEGMGASREMQFSAFAEPGLLLGLAAISILSKSYSLSEIYSTISLTTNAGLGPACLLVTLSFAIVFLTENSRIPVDDPNTHLELTMIHEVMVLDHGGPDLAFIEYASALKLWILGSLISGLVFPFRFDSAGLNLATGVAGIFAVAILVGAVESAMARLKLVRVPQFLIAATILSLFAIVMAVR